MERKNELSVTSKVSYEVGSIQFANYDEILSQAQELAELIATVEVDENSIKGTKKLLASVNKKVDELERERIRIKNELLVPYLEFEKQIKTINGVVKASDNELRNKVRALEELERQHKAGIISDMFNKRIQNYPTIQFFTASHFIKPSHLNKSMSLNKVELDMVQWLEGRKSDVQTILAFGGNLEKYIDTLDLNGALPVPEQTVDTSVPKMGLYATLQVDANRLVEVQLFLKMNGIDFKLA